MTFSNKATNPVPSRFEALLSTLPSELRLEIYTYALQSTVESQGLDPLSDHRDIQWLSLSPALFSEAAPLLYSTLPFRCEITFVHQRSFGTILHNTAKSTLGAMLRHHAETTFLHERRWALQGICGMLRTVIVEVPMRWDEYPLLKAEFNPARGRWCFSDPDGALTGPRRLTRDGFPVLPAVRAFTLRLRDLVAVEKTSGFWDACFGNAESSAQRTRLARNTKPLIDDVECEIDEVNVALRRKMPAVEEIEWEVHATDEYATRGDSPIIGLDTRYFLGAVARWRGCWKADKGMRGNI